LNPSFQAEHRGIKPRFSFAEAEREGGLIIIEILVEV
jgi:hypothetical protein